MYLVKYPYFHTKAAATIHGNIKFGIILIIRDKALGIDVQSGLNCYSIDLLLVLKGYKLKCVSNDIPCNQELENSFIKVQIYSFKQFN